ncbi:C-type lectin domain-containing protein [Caenorhabditis elegans]|uniref:C-type lectin domain-containing protein n=1 Tax=Caenorhabditis elegans TaxID=6239 RepID=Q19313_CAEEL|nr:C-type lectin domain-containing protein [Caenorhabditis elegans]CAA84652.2 C-type lectin domain-containing protein [Caenorhabditis elegans]|eukprot:NP_497944.2 C-type LECtin [Caenorhabditis elegans]
MRLKIFMALSLLCYTNAQVDRDWSFQQMCEFWGGEQTYRARSGYKSIEGDKCTFKFPKASNNKESAQRYCEETVPYHINNPKASEYKTTCEAEATLICKSGWVQMFGRCYKITKTMMTRDKAEEHCKNQQDQTSTIAFMHREALPFRWNDYFTRVSRIWMDASEVVTNDLIHDVEGGNVLLAFDGYKYNLPNVAIARVSKNETAMVLCEYTPSMTKAESNYLLRRYGEIYYPPLVTSESAYMRTTSSRIRNEEDPLADHNYCTELMKPVFRGGEAQSALPTQEFVKKLTETGAAEIIRTSSVSMNANKGERTIVDCVSHVDPYHRVHVKGDKNEETSITLNKTIWRQQEPHETCDAATWSSAAVLSRDSNRGLEAMSDARYAPLYCENILEYFSYSKCPEGFSEFPRVTSGQRWCHKYVHGAPLPYDDAEKKCAEMGAHLSGFTTQEEFKFLNELVNKEYPNKNDIEVWLGAQRKMSCPDAGKNFNGGFSTNEFDNCARSRVFEWRNGVAKNPPDFIGSGYDNWAELDEPNHLSDKERCVVMMHGKITKYWGYSSKYHDRRDMQINDIFCDWHFEYFCGLEVPVITVKKSS